MENEYRDWFKVRHTTVAEPGSCSTPCLRCRLVRRRLSKAYFCLSLHSYFIPFHPEPTEVSSVEELAALEAGWQHGLAGIGALVAFTYEPCPPLEATRLTWGD
jgi:hypothetical protein